MSGQRLLDEDRDGALASTFFIPACRTWPRMRWDRLLPAAILILPRGHRNPPCAGLRAQVIDLAAKPPPDRFWAFSAIASRAAVRPTLPSALARSRMQLENVVGECFLITMLGHGGTSVDITLISSRAGRRQIRGGEPRRTAWSSGDRKAAGSRVARSRDCSPLISPVSRRCLLQITHGDGHAGWISTAERSYVPVGPSSVNDALFDQPGGQKP